MTDTTAPPWRLFIALPMDGPAAARLDAILRPYASGFPGARWQRPDAFHVTLRFLGATPPGRVDELVDGMQSCARRHGAIPMSTGRGEGTSRSRGGVCWLRIERGHEQTAALSGCLTNASPGTAGMRPHLTVARRADAPLMDALSRGTLGEPAIEWLADRMVLYRSHTGTPAGSRYEELASVPLGAAPAA